MTYAELVAEHPSILKRDCECGGGDLCCSRCDEDCRRPLTLGEILERLPRPWSLTARDTLGTTWFRVAWDVPGGLGGCAVNSDSLEVAAGILLVRAEEESYRA